MKVTSAQTIALTCIASSALVSAVPSTTRFRPNTDVATGNSVPLLATRGSAYASRLQAWDRYRKSGRSFDEDSLLTRSPTPRDRDIDVAQSGTTPVMIYRRDLDGEDMLVARNPTGLRVLAPAVPLRLLSNFRKTPSSGVRTRPVRVNRPARLGSGGNAPARGTGLDGGGENAVDRRDLDGEDMIVARNPSSTLKAIPIKLLTDLRTPSSGIGRVVRVNRPARGAALGRGVIRPARETGSDSGRERTVTDRSLDVDQLD